MRLPDAIDKLRPSIVQIRLSSSPTAPSATLGTGFIATDAFHVVTAKHVIDAVDHAAGQSLDVGFAGPTIDTPQLKIRASFAVVPGHVLDVSDRDDLALLEVPGAGKLPIMVQVGPQAIRPSLAAAVISTVALREGVELAVSGYPLNQPSLVTTAGVLASSFSPDGLAGEWQDRYLGDFTANPGNSGGPVYTVHDGSVVGVCVAARLAPIVGGAGAQAAGLTVIVPSAQVVALLARNGLHPTATTALAVTGTLRSTNAKRKR